MSPSHTCALLALTGLRCFAQTPAQGVDLDEVRIRSAIYAPPPAFTISVQSSLVQVAATVRDRKGQAVGGYKAEDFELTDNGTRQEITAFTELPGTQKAGTGRPRYLALFFDDSHTSGAGLQRARDAAAKVIETNLEANDRAGIFTDSGTVTAEFTGDRDTLLTALSRIRPHPNGMRTYGGCPPLTPLEAYLIARRMDLRTKQRANTLAVQCNCPPPSTSKDAPVDTAYQACVDEQMASVQSLGETIWDMIRPQSLETIEAIGLVVRHLARAPGDRSLIVVSGGILAGGLEPATDALVDAAIRSRVVIHALHAEGLNPDRNAALATQAYTQFLAAAANGTGGTLIRNTNDFPGGLRALATPPAVSYLLGFSPRGEPDNSFHNLRMRLKNRGPSDVKYRPGYYSEAAQKAETVQQRIDREANSDESANNFPVLVRISQATGRVRVDLQVDVSDFRFAEHLGRSLQQLTFVTVIRDASGNYVTGKQAVMDLALGQVKLAEFRAGGIRTNTSFELPKGSYQVREIVREIGQNRMTTSTRAVEVQ
jgi:VWFA-related protein